MLEKDLQTTLIQAVLNGHRRAVRKGGEMLIEYFSKTKTTGPQALDYLPPEQAKVREGGGNQLADAWLLRCRAIIIASLKTYWPHSKELACHPTHLQVQIYGVEYFSQHTTFDNWVGCAQIMPLSPPSLLETCF